MKAGAVKATRVRWWIFFLAAAASWLLYLHRYTWGVIKFKVKVEFGLSDIDLGWLDSAFNGAYALGQVPAGLLGDLLGPAIVLPVIILAWSGAVAATGLAPGFWSLAGVRALFGAAQAGAYPNLSKVTRSWFPLSIRTTIQGLVASLAGRSGGACASLLLSTVLMGEFGLGWRTALVWLSGSGAGLAVLFWICYRDSPAQHPWVNEAERRLVEGGDAPLADEAADAPRAGARTKIALDLSPAVMFRFGALLLQMFTVAFADMLFVNWIPLFLAEEKGLDEGAMGIFASLPHWGGALGGMAGGVLNDVLIRAVGPRLARSAVGFSGLTLGALLLAASIGIEDGRRAMVVLAAVKFFADWSQPTVWGAVTDIGGRAAGTVFGAVNTAGSLGAFAAGPVLGSIKEGYGWSAVFWTVAGVYLVSALSWLAIDCTRRIVVETVRPQSGEVRSP